MNEHCFGDLGCITTDSDFFHPIHRPVNLPPYPREQINVLFTVHTREDREGTVVEALDLPKIANTTFTPERMTKILIHGFLDGSFVTWMLVSGFWVEVKLCVASGLGKLVALS